MDLEFAQQTAKLRSIAQAQAGIDAQFAKDSIELRRKLFQKKISLEKFWEEYKKSLQKTTKNNNKLVSELIKKIDKKMKQKIEQEQKNPEPEYPDLNLQK